MNKQITGIVVGLLVFVAIIFSGFFSAWIGGIQPFTKEAGWMAGWTICVAGVFGFVSYGSISHG